MSRKHNRYATSRSRFLRVYNEASGRIKLRIVTDTYRIIWNISTRTFQTRALRKHRVTVELRQIYVLTNGYMRDLHPFPFMHRLCIRLYSNVCLSPIIYGMLTVVRTRNQRYYSIRMVTFRYTVNIIGCITIYSANMVLYRRMTGPHACITVA